MHVYTVTSGGVSTTTDGNVRTEVFSAQDANPRRPYIMGSNTATISPSLELFHAAS